MSHFWTFRVQSAGQKRLKTSVLDDKFDGIVKLFCFVMSEEDR